MRLRKPRLRRARKEAYAVIDGPMRGHTLWLSDHAGTMPVAFKGQQGRYVIGGRMQLRWEALPAAER